MRLVFISNAIMLPRGHVLDRSRGFWPLWLRLRTPAEIFVKYGPCSPRRLAPVPCHLGKVARTSLYAHVDAHINLSHGPVQHKMLKLRGSLGQLTMGLIFFCHAACYHGPVFVVKWVRRRSAASAGAVSIPFLRLRPQFIILTSSRLAFIPAPFA